MHPWNFWQDDLALCQREKVFTGYHSFLSIVGDAQELHILGLLNPLGVRRRESIRNCKDKNVSLGKFWISVNTRIHVSGF